MTDSQLPSAQYCHYARERRQAGDFEAAADYYTAEAYGNFMRFRRSPEFAEKLAGKGEDAYPQPDRLAWGVRELLLAALCYRLADVPDRAANRSRHGILVVEELREHDPIFERTTHRGWCYEAIGDLRLFGGLDGYDAAYAEAEQQYAGTDNPIQWQAEGEFEFLIQPLLRLADSVAIDISDETREAIRRRSLTDRIEYKRSAYPDIVAAVLDEGNCTPESCAPSRLSSGVLAPLPRFRIDSGVRTSRSSLLGFWSPGTSACQMQESWSRHVGR